MPRPVFSTSIPEAGREVIRNTRQYGEDYKLSYENGIAEVTSFGPSLELKHFALGVSSPGVEDRQFGEGLKMAALRFADAGRTFEIETAGYNYTAKIEHDPEFGVDLLVLTRQKNRKRKDVIVRFECTPNEWKRMLAFFRDLTPTGRKSWAKKHRTPIWLPGGDIYVRGVYVARLPGLLFSYDFDNEYLVDRDRRNVSNYYLVREMRTMMSKHLTDLYMVRHLLTAWQNGKSRDALEYQVLTRPSNRRIRKQTLSVWRRVASQVFEQHAIADEVDAEWTLAAMDAGYRILRPDRNVKILLERLGVPSAQEDV